MKEIPPHIPVLDSLRCLASVSVCLFHFVSKTIGFVQNETIKNIFNAGAHGVEVFFVISGFIIPWSLFQSGYKLNDFFRFMKKRFARIYPPYIVAVLASLAFVYLRSISHTSGEAMHPDVKQVLLHFGFLVPFFHDQHWLNPVFWTLSIEMEYYILIGITFNLFSNSSVYFRVAGYLIFLGPCLLPGANFSFIQLYLPVFLLGILCFMYYAKKINNIELIFVALISFTTIYFFRGVVVTSAALIPFVFILLLPTVETRVTKFVGKISYSLYLVHTLTGTALVNYFSHHPTTGIQKVFIVAAALLFSILASWLMFLIIEKPAMRLSSKIKLKNKTA